MTFQEVYRRGRQQLEKAGIDTASFDAIRLFQHVFGLDRQALILRGGEDCGPGLDRFQSLIRRRAAREPLQYLLGEWEFMDFSLAVGEGVLIPREETELLVYAAAEALRKSRGGWEDPARVPLALDLCAGSGAVEPVFAVVGYFLAANLAAAQPWFLAFAAGAMIFVVVEDLIPAAHLSEHPHFGTWGSMVGFAVMMALDVALG